METGLLPGSGRGARKVLGPSPSKAVQNKIDKLALFNSKTSFRGFNAKHLEGLLNLDFQQLSPSDFIRVLEVLNRNLYREEHLLRSLYKSLCHKINYFNLEELLTLIESIAPFSLAKHAVEPRDLAQRSIDPEGEGSEEEPSDLATVEPRGRELYELQHDILHKVTGIIHNKLRFGPLSRRSELFRTKTRCLALLNRFSFLDRWSTLLALCKDVTNQAASDSLDQIGRDPEEQVTPESILAALNCAADTLALKSIDLICKDGVLGSDKNGDLTEVDRISLTLLDHRDTVLNYYSKGGLQVLNLLVNCQERLNGGLVEGLERHISDLKTMCKLVSSMCTLLPQLRSSLALDEVSRTIEEFLRLNFKLFYCAKFLRHVDSHSFNGNYEMDKLCRDLHTCSTQFLSHKGGLNNKSRSLLLCLLSEPEDFPAQNHLVRSESESCSDSRGTLYELIVASGSLVVDAVRGLCGAISDPKDLTSLDCINTLECLYLSFGYINHYVARKLLDYTLNNFPKNALDGVVILRALLFSRNLPFGQMYTGLTSVKRSLELALPSRLNTHSFDFKSLGMTKSMTPPWPLYKSSCAFDLIPRARWDLHVVKSYSTATLTGRFLPLLFKHKFFPLY